ncbi:coenzyme F420-0:L-glutamate ligase [Filifactor alocis]|uniref:coenzyme F420-0:L-glutamate ligase n=1 Tax=Filifactor alocis TaxID=143361 RepID=UPI003F9FE766
MSRCVGTISRGIRTGIIREGDDLSSMIVNSLMEACESDNIKLNDRDVLGVTEAVLARAQGNYATVDQIACDVKEKFKNKHIGLIFPILSRNRFAICLKGIAKGVDKITLVLNYPSDEVGNHLISLDDLDREKINPYSDVLTEERYRDLFGYKAHVFTGVDYIEYYKELILSQNCEVEVILSNNPNTVLEHTKYVLNCDIHTRARTKRILLESGAEQVLSLDDIMNYSINGSGYNADYGLLGSNKSTEESVKLFPRNANEFVTEVQNKIKDATGKTLEVLVYGDGAFKDPVGKIWELADPVVSPGYTSGLEGQPNELKLKYLADNDFASLKGEALKEAIVNSIQKKEKDLKGSMVTQGTTPRRLTDLIGSLCDLTSGSGDKGTPIVLIQGYFDNYAD